METPRRKIYRMASLLSESKSIIDTMTKERSELLSRMENLTGDLDAIKKACAARETHPKVDTSTETELAAVSCRGDEGGGAEKGRGFERDVNLNSNAAGDPKSGQSARGRSKLIDEEVKKGEEEEENEEQAGGFSPGLSGDGPETRDASRGARGGYRSSRKLSSRQPESELATRKVGRQLNKLLDMLGTSGDGGGGGSLSDNNREGLSVEDDPRRRKKDKSSCKTRSRLRKHFKELERLRRRQEEQDEELLQQRRFFRELRAASRGSRSTPKENSQSSESESDLGRQPRDIRFDRNCVALDGDVTLERIRVPNQESVRKSLVKMHMDNLIKMSLDHSVLETSRKLSREEDDKGAKSRSGERKPRNRSVHFENRSSSPRAGEGRPPVAPKPAAEKCSKPANASEETSEDEERAGVPWNVEQAVESVRKKDGRRSSLGDTNNSAIVPREGRKSRAEKIAGGGGGGSGRMAKEKSGKKAKRQSLKVSPGLVSVSSSASSRDSSKVSDRRDGSSSPCEEEEEQHPDDIDRFLLRQVKKEQENLEKEILQHRIELDQEKKKLMDFMQESQKNRKNVSEEIQRYLSELEGGIFADAGSATAAPPGERTELEKESGDDPRRHHQQLQQQQQQEQSEAKAKTIEGRRQGKTRSAVELDKSKDVRGGDSSKQPKQRHSDLVSLAHPQQHQHQQQHQQQQGEKKPIGTKSPMRMPDCLVSLSYPLKTSKMSTHGRFRAMNEGVSSSQLPAKPSAKSTVTYTPPGDCLARTVDRTFLDSLASLEIGQSPSGGRRERRKNSSFSVWD